MRLTASSADGKQKWPAREKRQILIDLGQQVTLEASVKDGPEVKAVEFRAGDRKVGQTDQAPWTLTWTPPSVGARVLYAMYNLADGSKGVSNPGVVAVAPKAE